jgi:hypothetical protein
MTTQPPLSPLPRPRDSEGTPHDFVMHYKGWLVFALTRCAQRFSQRIHPVTRFLLRTPTTDGRELAHTHLQCVRAPPPAAPSIPRPIHFLPTTTSRAGARKRASGALACLLARPRARAPARTCGEHAVRCARAHRALRARCTPRQRGRARARGARPRRHPIVLLFGLLSPSVCSVNSARLEQAHTIGPTTHCR